MGKLGKFQAIVTWEQRKLGELITEHSELVTGYHFPIATSARTGLFFQAEYFDKGRSDINEGVIFHVVPKNFVTYRHMSDDSIFHFNKNTFDTPVQVSREYPVFTNNDKVNLDFLVQNLNFSGSFLKFSKMQKRGGTRTRLYYKVLQQYRISVPEVDEQDEISGFMKKIDKTIALHERKLELMKVLKKAYLQQLFPKNGDKTPHLRFAGFSDDWEQRKSKIVFNSVTEKGHPNLPVVSVTQEKGIIFRKEMDRDLKFNKKNLGTYKVIHPNDFVISLRSFQGGFEVSKILGITSPAYTVFSFKYPNNHSISFWKFYFKKYNFVQMLKIVTYGIRDGRSISYADFASLSLTYPLKNEQEKIGKILEKVAVLIAADEHKLDILYELRRAYSQKLFV